MSIIISNAYVFGGEVAVSIEREIFSGCDFEGVVFHIDPREKISSPLFRTCYFGAGNAALLDPSLFENCFIDEYGPVKEKPFYRIFTRPVVSWWKNLWWHYNPFKRARAFCVMAVRIAILRIGWIRKGRHHDLR